ncbi:unnamed protein product [Linum tenue]|uniref:GTP cyclohydrolase 1 n=1 Tax=Linum tenue TaxID=586396 RepID=A0AAV0RXB0_9ROSI|nr:unnamed protein product [Linum tenue]
MGALDEGHFHEVLENGVELEPPQGIEGQPETLAIEDAVKVLLQGLGEDINREGIKKTPLRVAKALREGTKGYKQKVKDIVEGALFPEAGLDAAVGNAGGAGGLVVVRDLDLFSYCESCLLPFQFKCHVGYIPSGQRVVGLSKLSRVADVFAKRLQDPQRLANEVCSALHHWIKPAGIAVVLQCWHMHFPSLESFLMESNSQGWLKVLVRSGTGAFENDKGGSWSDFFSLLKFRGINIDNFLAEGSIASWCPSQSWSSLKGSSINGQLNSGMVTAVDSILRSLGEDPSREELVGTPVRFVKWLTNFQNTSFEMKLNGFVYGRGVDSLKANGEPGVNHKQEQLQTEVNLSFWSQCEHHLLPFYGVVHIGYFGFNPIPKSLLKSIVHFYGFKLQVQERLTRQIAETVSSLVGGDVMVVLEAGHTCMISRGIEKFGSSTATIAVLGRFSADPNARAMFLQSLPNSSTALGPS